MGYVLLVMSTAIMTALANLAYLIDRSNGPLRVDWNATGGIIYENLRYGDRAGEAYDLYIPGHASKRKFVPLILFIHGGGFTGGSRHDEDLWCKYFSAHGYITATIDYTLHDKRHPDAGIPLMNREVGTAVYAIKMQAAKLGYGITGMALSGQSAGGALALLYAYSDAQSSPIPVRFVFEQSGPTDFSPKAWHVSRPAFAAAFLSLLTGKMITADIVRSGDAAAYARAISPVAYVSKVSVPTLLAYGARDRVVPTGQKFELIRALKADGVRYEYIEYPDSNHGMYSDLNSQKKFIEHALSYGRRYLRP